MSSHVAAHRSSTRWTWLSLRKPSRRVKIIASIIGAVLAGGISFAATSWTVGLNTGSSGEATAGSVGNISIVASASPAAGNLLFPGTNGDVVVKITNTNTVAVTLTAVNLPLNTLAAAGYTDSALTLPNAGCTAATSGVTWTDATAVSGSSHTLATPIVIGGGGNLTMLFTNEATMSTSSANACQSTYFSMPSFTGITATATPGATQSSFSSDSWT